MAAAAGQTRRDHQYNTYGSGHALNAILGCPQCVTYIVAPGQHGHRGQHQHDTDAINTAAIPHTITFIGCICLSSGTCANQRRSGPGCVKSLQNFCTFDVWCPQPLSYAELSSARGCLLRREPPVLCDGCFKFEMCSRASVLWVHLDVHAASHDVVRACLLVSGHFSNGAGRHEAPRGLVPVVGRLIVVRPRVRRICHVSCRARARARCPRPFIYPGVWVPRPPVPRRRSRSWHPASGIGRPRRWLPLQIPWPWWVGRG